MILQANTEQDFKEWMKAFSLFKKQLESARKDKMRDQKINSNMKK